MDAAKSVSATFDFNGYPGAGSAYARNYVQQAYVAYYGRPADPGGLDYWSNRMDAAVDRSIRSLPRWDFSGVNLRYGGLACTELVITIYQQSLGRSPEQFGLDYYVGELQAGRRTLQSITLDVLNGAVSAPDSTVVANKLDVAAYYTARVAAGCPYGAEQDGVSSLAGVTATSASVNSAKVGIDTRCGP